MAIQHSKEQNEMFSNFVQRVVRRRTGVLACRSHRPTAQRAAAARLRPAAAGRQVVHQVERARAHLHQA